MTEEIRTLEARIDLLHSLMLGLVTVQEEINNRQRQLNIEFAQGLIPGLSEAVKAGLN